MLGYYSEINLVCVTSIEAFFVPGEKIKVSFLRIKNASNCYMIIFTHEI
jgi:hypothetical protein